MASIAESFSVPDCERDRKSTRLNSSHSQISYAVFCLKKKKNKQLRPMPSASSHPAHGPNLPALCCALNLRSLLHSPRNPTHTYIAHDAHQSNLPTELT